MGKMGSFNTTSLKKFRDEVNRLQDPDKFTEACAKELAARLLGMVIKRTPVGIYKEKSGKKGGTLRRGWTGGKRASAKSYAESLQIRHTGENYAIDIINPVEYASYVEYGHRTANHKKWVNGQFMMTISERELEKIAPAVLEQKLKKYLEAFR